MTQNLSGFGRIPIFTDCTGSGEPVARTVAGPINFDGGFILTGDGLAEADSGAVRQSALNGVVRLTTTDEADHAVYLGTSVMYDVGRMGSIVAEARVSLPALTARRFFFGFSDENADAETNILTGSTATLTLTKSDLGGFFFDSGLTSKNWHTVYNGGTTAGVTNATQLDSDVAPVGGEFNVLRLVANKDGSLEYYIDGEHIATVAGALSTTVNLAVVCGVAATTTTVATGDVDYVGINAGRVWDIDNA